MKAIKLIRNNKIKKSFVMSIAIGAFCLSSPLFADTAQMNETLVRLVNQLDAMLPLIDEAEREQPMNERFTFHYSSFEGSDGKQHEGLREDVMSMKAALIAQINQPVIDPNTVASIPNDLIGGAR